MTHAQKFFEEAKSICETVSYSTVEAMLGDIERWRDAPLWDAASIARATETWFRYLGKEVSH